MSSETARIVARGKRVLELERDALGEAAARLDDAFAEAVRLIKNAKGRVIVAGIGKSGLIARKIAATMTSTGTPAYFLHPTESVHGDLGIVTDEDVALLLSKSGETSELLPLLEQLTRLGVPCIAITGNRESTLARNSRVALDGYVREEACPHDLAPTTSTTLALAVGDALAVALLEEKGFRREDFAKFHPGGSLGRKLLLRVRDVMIADPLPLLGAEATMREAIVVLAKQRGLGIALDADGRLEGVLTTGDLTRLMQRDGDVMAIRVGDVMTRRPKTVGADELASAAVHTMEQFGVIALPALDAEGRVAGVVHLHDLMRAGAA
ncbi:MAG TPA: KpsF/GutQ family sugar-phosphate isomerase [Gemmatimonadaceae bacterium]|nr:KpsF/GutQ family sugar-phosphate isomerase [Gemmatimonadaceae bacterium]HRQ79203.1 KpsF/GutQ family sugar-phosphate isomerase [Gemmatimonadaceae bacterium]